MWSQQHVVVRFHLHPAAPSFSSTTDSTSSLSPCRCFRFPSRAASLPLISVSRCCGPHQQTCPASMMMRGAVPLRQEGWLHEEEEEEDKPVSFIHLQPISSEAHFDRVLAETHQRGDAFLVVWTASWCRKCIYLKPKLEKLAVYYYPRLQFYSVDVNTVSHKLVARAGVTKMPTIQLWKDSKKQAEVIGGQKAYLVINEVQEMIENECTM